MPGNESHCLEVASFFFGPLPRMFSPLRTVLTNLSDALVGAVALAPRPPELRELVDGAIPAPNIDL